MSEKPKYLSKEDVVEDTSVYPRLLAPQSEVVTLEKTNVTEQVGRGIKGIILTVAIVLGVALALYAIASATLMAAVPTKHGITGVVRATFVGGVPEQGQFAFVSDDPGIDNGFGSRLLQGFIGVDSASTVEIVAGPYNAVSNGPDNEILVDGEPSGYYGKVTPVTLNKQYIAMCVHGDCETKNSDAVLVKQDAILGESKGLISTSGIQDFSSVKGKTETGESS